jgi:Electron transfer DM13
MWIRKGLKFAIPTGNFNRRYNNNQTVGFSEGDISMQKRNLVILAVLVLGAIAWYAFRPERLFIDQTVSEKFPAAAAPVTAAASSKPTVLYSGRFHDVAHKSTGNATLFQLQDGKRVLRLTEFETSNGPDVQLYMVAAADSRDNATVTNAGFVSLGALKGNKGDQNYDVPSDLDLGKYRSVTIWCRRFGVNFGTAPLAQPGEMPRATAQPMILSSGRFHDVAHKSAGSATIYQLADGKRVLRLAEFETSNGPDVQLYMVAAADARDNAAVTNAGFVSLGALKGNKGDQNYDVPSDLDLSKYRAATIWCRRFGVNFGTAPLTQQ